MEENPDDWRMVDIVTARDMDLNLIPTYNVETSKSIPLVPVCQVAHDLGRLEHIKQDVIIIYEYLGNGKFKAEYVRFPIRCTQSKERDKALAKELIIDGE